jgi:uncharacterized protein
MNRKLLLHRLRQEFILDWKGIHGAGHWGRVRRNGLRLAEATGADPQVVELFAWLHDVRRHDDGFDPEHGHRAAELAGELRGEIFELDDHRFELLCDACRGHSDGHTQGEVTILTCWDADRLDLGRIGVRPDPARLCTEAARDRRTIQWAWRRSRRRWGW